MAVLNFTVLGETAGAGRNLGKLGLDVEKLKTKLATFKGKRVLIDVKVNDAGAVTKINGVSAAADRAGRSAAAAHKGGITSLAGGLVKLGAVTLGVAGYMGVKAVKSAGDFQAQMTRLTTSAGETRNNIGRVSSGILQMAGQVGFSSKQLADGFYVASSAGFNFAHGGLDVLRASAEGAKAENADLGTVVNAVTDLLTDYHLKASDSANVTSKLVATTASGKLTFQDLAGAMSAIAPVASGANVKMSDMLGTLAEMTSHGVSAEQASQNLANAIRSLSNPSSVMRDELGQLGLNAKDVSQNLGKKGLAGTLDEISQAVLRHMGPSGAVLLSVFNQSKQSAQSARSEFENLSKSGQKLATQYMSGAITSRQFTLAVRGTSGPQAALLKQWQQAQDRSKGFTTAVKNGSGASQSFTQAMSKATGNATTLNVALQTTGQNAGATTAKIRNISAATSEAGGHVRGWKDIQQNFNQKLDQTKSSFGALVISIGQSLLPFVTKIAGGFSSFFNVLTRNSSTVKNFLKIAALIGGAFIIAGAGIKAFKFATDLAKAAQIAYAIVTRATTAAIVAEDAATEANPIVLIITGIILVIAALTVGIIALVKHWRQVWSAIKSAAETFARFWTNTFTGWILGGVNAVVGFVKRLYHDVVGWIHNTRNGAILWVSNLVNGVVNWFSRLWSSVVAWFRRIRNDVVTWVRSTRNGAILWVSNLVSGVVSKVSNLWSSVTNWFRRIKNDVVGWISNTANNAINIFSNLRNRLVSSASNIWHGLVKVFNNLKNDLFSIFKAIANNVFVKPINFVINTVIDRGVNGLIGALGKVFGQHWSVHVNGISGFQTGGQIPGGYGGGDKVPIMAEPGEWMLTKEQVRQSGGPGVIAQMFGSKAGGRGYHKGGMVPGYSIGGLIGDIGNAIGSAARTVGGAIKSGISSALGLARGAAASGVQSILNHTIYPLANKVSHPGMLGQLPNEITHKIGDALVSFIRGKDKQANNAISGGMIKFSGAGVQQWAPTVLKVLAKLHQPAGWLGTVLRRMNQESGGNPNAINRTDINAQRGDPSRGLMQTIGSTFQAYKPAGASNIYDPYSNIYAGLNYALHRYGSLAALNRPGGYANGGVFTSPTLGLMGEAGPEILLPLTRRGQARNVLQRAGIGGGSLGEVHHHHYHLTVMAKTVNVDDLEKAFRQMEARDGVAV
ncbi:MAG TPA: phage tail tape measure protein [Ktedonobacteraceae bacterium]|nr:phage tail tape measure protein [Ktedonobacteraceae bacterium]